VTTSPPTPLLVSGRASFVTPQSESNLFLATQSDSEIEDLLSNLDEDGHGFDLTTPSDDDKEKEEGFYEDLLSASSREASLLCEMDAFLRDEAAGASEPSTITLSARAEQGVMDVSSPLTIECLINKALESALPSTISISNLLHVVLSQPRTSTVVQFVDGRGHGRSCFSAHRRH